MIKPFSLLAIATFLAGQLHAAVIPDVTINSVSSEYSSGATDQRRATNAVSGAGLFGENHSDDPKGSMWLTSPATVDGLTNAFITFDLGSVHSISKMKVWNYNEKVSGANILTRRGIKTANISVAGEDLVFTTNLANQTFTRATGTFSTAHDTLDMGGVSARYVRFNVITNYGEADFRVGLSEVQFVDNTVAPSVRSATRNFSGNRVTVRFSETILLSTATNLTNYVVKSGATIATVTNATINSFQDTVVLQTSALDSNLVYTVTVQNVRDAADTMSIASTQLNVDPELILWLKADENVTEDGSGFVSQWDDKSGLANNALQPTGGIQPTLVPGAVNGKPAVHFDGLTQVMEVPSNATLTSDRDITIYTVLSIDTQTGGKSPISRVNVNIPASFDYQIVATTGKPSFVRGNGSGFTTFGGSTAGLSINQFYIASVVMRGTNVTHYLNGNFNGTGFIGAPIGDLDTPIRLGLRADAATKFTGNLAEVIVLNGAASDADQSAINNYLGNKYGISVVTLNIVSQPESTTRLVGQKATFGVAATAGTPTILYQWKKGASIIAGATNAVYTTPALTLLDDASTYSVVVSTPLGVTTNSTSATLSVLSDTKSPTIYSATKSTNATDIVVNFSEAVEFASATNPAHYSLSGGATILSASMGSASNVVILTTSGVDGSTSYRLTVQNVQDLFSNAMTSMLAPVLPANAAFWIRADSGILTNPSDMVSQSDDQTVNQNTASQFKETSRRPVLVQNAINNKPALRFDGTSSFLEAASSPSLAISGDITIFAVANFTDFAAGREIVSKTAVNQPASFDYYVQFSPLVTRLYRGNGTVSGVITGTAPSAGVPHVLSVMQEGTEITHFLEGAPVGTGTLTNLLGDTGAPLRVGSRNDLFQYMKGDIAELLIFNSALSSDERAIVQNYLGAKYFPFSITEQPASIARLQGQTATFKVVAEAGGASFEYQWQKNLADIPGATDASYTTPTLVLGDDNSSYRAVIILADGTTFNCDPALLSVSPDQESPTVVHSGIKLWNGNQIVVTFSEAVASASATSLNNYALDNGATITSAVMGNTPNEVVLTVSNLVHGNSYNLTVQNVVDLFNNAMSQSSASVGVYPANLSLWLDGDSNVAFDGQNLVSTWGDLSGNFNDANAIGASNPLHVPNAINGHSVLRFDGTNQFLAANPSESLALTGDMTIFVVANFRDFVSTENEIGMLGKSSANQPAPYDFYLLKTSGLPRFYRGNGTENGSITGTVAPSAGFPHIVSVQMSGTDASMYLDGQPNGSGTINVVPADGGGLLGIGTRDDLRPKMNGDLAEILMFGQALSTADRQDIENYLAAKYGILASPVSLSIQSSNGSVVISWPVGGTSFTLKSTANLSAPNWTTVTNAVETSGGFNRVTVSPADDQNFYRLQNP